MEDKGRQRERGREGQGLTTRAFWKDVEPKYGTSTRNSRIYQSHEQQHHQCLYSLCVDIVWRKQEDDDFESEEDPGGLRSGDGDRKDNKVSVVLRR